MRLGRCSILISVDGVPVSSRIGTIRIEVGWGWRRRVDCGHNGEVILKLVEVQVCICERMIQRIE